MRNKKQRRKENDKVLDQTGNPIGVFGSIYCCAICAYVTTLGCCVANNVAVFRHRFRSIRNSISNCWFPLERRRQLCIGFLHTWFISHVCVRVNRLDCVVVQLISYDYQVKDSACGVLIFLLTEIENTSLLLTKSFQSPQKRNFALIKVIKKT